MKNILCTLLLMLPGLSLTAEKDREVMPPSILPVIFLQGTDYEMGYQYGLQAADYIAVNREAAWAAALQRFSREEVLRALSINQYYIRTCTPENIDIMRGMADGCKEAGRDVSYVDIVLLNSTLPDPETSSYPGGANQESLPPEKGCSVCSAWGSATKEGRLIGLDTLDGGEDALYGVILVVFPESGNAYICGAQAGEIGDHFLMNNRGFFLGNSGGGGSPRKIDENYGIGWACSLPHIVRFADNAPEARDMIMQWRINVPENFHFADVHGNALVVEKTAAVQAVRKSGDFGEHDFLFSTNNYLHETMRVTKEGGFIGGHGGYGAYSAPRNQVFWDMLHNYAGDIDREFMKMILRFPGNPPPWPPANGWSAKICRPTNSWVSVSEPDDGDEGCVHICTGPAGRVIHSSIAFSGEPMRSTYQYIDGTHTFYTLRLKTDPLQVSEAARGDAKRSIARAYREFMQLTPRDAGYGVCKALFGEANREYYRGQLALNKAQLASGRDAVRLFSEAATGYTRAQAKAEALYEALVPPPSSPSDLGLRPFGGDWAKWETESGGL
ncbi:hypothetical protein JXO52_07770 [bacterium]|nr:hypothetical protein [bacterium]